MHSVRLVTATRPWRSRTRSSRSMCTVAETRSSRWISCRLDRTLTPECARPHSNHPFQPWDNPFLPAFALTTLQISGKVNNVAIDSCSKTGVVFSDVIASCEVINCQSVQLQTTGIVPTISVEKTDGCTLYLSKKVRKGSRCSTRSPAPMQRRSHRSHFPLQLTQDTNFQIVTAKCSAMNVVVSNAGEERLLLS